ncbi:glycosyltransferase [Amycolatopsis sp. NPDC088138]|uniref:glycosyltransferase n=1 Tax=Amycolatopsis sp. NPDC088138 TaxID=3363938 RepID=UPI0037F76160
MAERAGRVTTACTVVTRAGLPSARVLARTYRQHHPDHDFLVLVVDGTSGGTEDGCRVVGGDWLDLDRDEFHRMATWFPAADLVDAVKPLLLHQLLEDSDVAVCLGFQTRVFAPFDDLTAKAAEHDIVLAPRVLAPVPQDGLEPGREPADRAFHEDFVAVGKGARPFLIAWADGLRYAPMAPPSVPSPPVEHFFDRVPALYRHVVTRDPGVAAGFWNLHERKLAERPDGTVTAGGAALRFLNFHGFDPEQPWLLSTQCPVRPRVVLSTEPVLRGLCGGYAEALTEAGHTGEEVPYGFGRLRDGTPLTRPMRTLYRDTWLRAHRAATTPAQFAPTVVDEIPPPPFGDDHGAAFREWLCGPGSPMARSAGLSRLALWLWAGRIDLQTAFREPQHEDGPAFRQWCATHGVDEGLLPGWALPAEPPPVTGPVDEFGVNVAGYLTAELGLGEMGRIVHRVVAEAGVPVVSVVEARSLSAAVRTALAAPDTVKRPRFPVSILAVNSDYTRLLLDSHPELGHRRYRIGLWAWELEDFPTTMRGGLDLVDEVWALSDFTRRAIEPHSTVPVKTFPMPVPDPGKPARIPRRPGDPVRFLFAFDFNSTGQRKNPWGAVAAFQRAFPGRDDVRLVVKATNGHLHAAAVERLRYVIGDDKRIDLLEAYLSVEELGNLYASSDAYVSLHRSEGFGLTVAEAMVRGLAVIATDYSSTTEFFHDGTGWPIPHGMIEVGEGWPPYQPEAVWADPDLDAAAKAMREVADDPEEARRRGEAARAHVLRTRSMASAAAWAETQLRAAYETWRGRDFGTAADAPKSPLARAEEALHWQPDPAGPHRFPLAPVFRRAVRRALSHYDGNQRRILRTLTESTGEAIGGLAGRFDDKSTAQDRRLGSLEAEIARQNARIEQLEARRPDGPRRPA